MGLFFGQMLSVRNSPGIVFDVYDNPDSTYPIPGPAVYVAFFGYLLVAPVLTDPFATAGLVATERRASSILCQCLRVEDVILGACMRCTPSRWMSKYIRLRFASSQ